MTTRSLAAVKAHLSQVIDEVAATHERSSSRRTATRLPSSSLSRTTSHSRRPWRSCPTHEPGRRSGRPRQRWRTARSTARPRCAPHSRPATGERPTDLHRRPLGSREAGYRTRPARTRGRGRRRLPVRVAGHPSAPRRKAAALRSSKATGPPAEGSTASSTPSTTTRSSSRSCASHTALMPTADWPPYRCRTGPDGAGVCGTTASPSPGHS